MTGNPFKSSARYVEPRETVNEYRIVNGVKFGREDGNFFMSDDVESVVMDR